MANTLEVVKSETVDLKRIIVQMLIAQKNIFREHSPECVSIERIQETVRGLRRKLPDWRNSVFIDASRDAIERTVFFNSIVLDINEDAGLVYFKNEEPKNSDINDEYYLSDKIKEIINVFTEAYLVF